MTVPMGAVVFIQKIIINFINNFKLERFYGFQF